MMVAGLSQQVLLSSPCANAGGDRVVVSQGGVVDNIPIPRTQDITVVEIEE